MTKKKCSEVIYTNKIPLFYSPFNYEPNVLLNAREQIRSWTEFVAKDKFILDLEKFLIGQTAFSRFLGRLFDVLCSIGIRESFPNMKENNFLITSDHGEGKTYSANILVNYFKKYLTNVPVAYLDMKETGGLADIAENIALANGYGIVFLDNIDSVLSGANGNEQDLLRVLLKHQSGNSYLDSTGKTYKLDSTNTIFIGFGTFETARNIGNKKGTRELNKKFLVETGLDGETLSLFEEPINYTRLTDEQIYDVIRFIMYEIGQENDCDIVAVQKYMEQLLEIYNTCGFKKIKLKIKNDIMPICMENIIFQNEYGYHIVCLGK